PGHPQRDAARQIRLEGRNRVISKSIPWFDRKATIPSSRPTQIKGQRSKGQSMMAEGHRRRRRVASLTVPRALATLEKIGRNITVAHPVEFVGHLLPASGAKGA